MRAQVILIVLTLMLSPGAALGQAKDDAKENPSHAELRALKEAVVAAFNKRDVDALLKHLHKDVVVTWQNGEVSRGHAGVRDYYDRMMVGDKSVVVDVKAAPEVKELSVLHGGDQPNTAIAFGTLNDEYKLRDGMEFKMNSLWSATLVKEGGQWTIAAFHASTNVFDNSVLALAVKKSMTVAGVGGLAVGAILAWVLLRMMRRSK